MYLTQHTLVDYLISFWQNQQFKKSWKGCVLIIGANYTHNVTVYKSVVFYLGLPTSDTGDLILFLAILFMPFGFIAPKHSKII
jgi:hypothetical protein